jgi:hypothetical protein
MLPTASDARLTAMMARSVHQTNDAAIDEQESRWSPDDIPYHAMDRERIRAEPYYFIVLAASSFVEITSELYTRTLVDFFRPDSEVTDWLEQQWEAEELCHGSALKRYVQTAWPEFDWDATYRDFLAEYSQFCSVDQLAATRTLELASRCVVETGTAVFYRMLSNLSPEPVLRQLTAAISLDEVRHYKYFYRYFQRYRDRERPGRVAVARALWDRIDEIDTEDAFCAFKHVYLARNPGTAFNRSDFEGFLQAFGQYAKSQFPYDMAVRMLLKPLGFSPMVGRMLLPTATAATRLFWLR